MSSPVGTARYSARIGESYCLGEELPYDALVRRIVEFTVRAAVARALDESAWEQEEIRRNGLAAVQLARNGKALWADEGSFEIELAEAKREHVETRFKERNACDASVYERLDRDVRASWRAVGYETPSLRNDMKKLFLELQRDASDRTARALESLVAEVVQKPGPRREAQEKASM
jgi:hypothetical protein